jgi:hypothetical protein
MHTCSFNKLPIKVKKTFTQSFNYLALVCLVLFYQQFLLAANDESIFTPDDTLKKSGPIMITTGWYQVPKDVYFHPDAFHSFNKRKHIEKGMYEGLSWGGRMFQGQEVPEKFREHICVEPGGINKILADYKLKTGKNAEVKLIEFTLLDFVLWRCEWVAYIGESSSGTHYTHVGTRGGIGGGKYHPDSTLYNKHPGTSGTIPVQDIQIGGWKYVPIRIREVRSVEGHCPNEQAQPGTIEVVNAKHKLILRQFFVQSNSKIY